MNFFGHAAVASWHEPTPGRVLGAMLPDFATMSGARLGEGSDADIASGIDLHHTTDAAFHRAPVVLGLMRELDERLASHGCARGPRRAAAHIGMELLLDGVLVDEPSYRAHYIAALERDANGIVWREHADRFTRLLARLRTYGVPDDLRKPEAIVQRLHRMLSHRPLLAPNAADLRAIETSLIEYKPRVVVSVDTVLRAVRAALS